MITDGAWVLFEHDPTTGRTVWVTEQDGKSIFRIDYPAQATIDANAEYRALTEHDRFGDWVRIGSVPLNVAYDGGLNEAMNQQDDKFVSRFFNDSDNRAWRTSRGKV